MSMILLKPPPYILNMYVRLRTPHLLKPSYKSFYAIGANEASLYFRHLKLYLCFHLIKLSSHYRVAVISLSQCYCLDYVHHVY